MNSGSKPLAASQNGTSGAVREPVHQQVYRQLRELILFGELAPGQAVTIQGLVEQLDAGMTPVREAIRRLTAEGALEFQGNRRVSVPLLSPENINELIFARQALEPQLAEKATKNADAADILDLSEIDELVDRAIESGDVRAYLEQNYRFHSKLYQLADSPILADISDGLWLRYGPSLRVICGRLGTQNLPDRHKETLDAMRAGDSKAAALAIREDVLQGMDQMQRVIDES